MDIIGLFSDSLGISREVTSSILVSIAVFVLGLLTNGLVRAIRKFRERSRIRKLVNINSELLIKQLKIEVENLKLFEEQLRIDHNGPIRYKWTNLPYVPVFLEIGYSNLYNAYFSGIENWKLWLTKEKLKAFTTLWNTISFLDKHHEDSRIRAEGHVQLNSSYNESRNMVVGKAQKMIEDFRISFHKKVDPLDPLGCFFSEREQIIKVYADTPNRVLPKITNDYLNRILQHMRSNVDLCSRYPNDIKSVELSTYILEGSYRFDSQKHHLESASFYFNNLYKEYDGFRDKLKNSIKTLNR